MNELASEILVQIASDFRGDQKTLHQLSLVSRKWYNIANPFLYRAPQFYRSNSFESFYKNLTNTNGTFLRELDLHMVPHRWDEEMNYKLQQIIGKIPQLELLNLDLCYKLTNEVLISFVESLPNLIILSVDQCSLIGDRSIIKVLQQCNLLKEIYLGSTRISDTTLMAMPIHAQQLVRLHLTGCGRITETGVKAIIAQQKGLQHLDIKCCTNVIGTFGDMDHTLRSLEYDDEDNDGWEDEDDGDGGGIFTDAYIDEDFESHDY
ncbi:RNI-like protein [Backusella circina FSU 941]|nr:RNI-like protein [Backusella circina FSU 941]